jgi:glycosyltransferase involved in cell wall biosynthesis
MTARTKFFVEAIPLVEEHPSGVGHSLLGLVSALAHNPSFTKDYEIVLVAPKRGLHNLDRWPELSHCTRIGLPLRMRILNGLMKFHLLPPMDVLLGQGVYLFGNFKNWPLTSRSTSLTYLHDICYALFPEFVAPKNQRMLARNVPRFIRRSTYVVTVSESSKAEIVDYYHVNSEKVLVLYNGVDTTVYHPYPAAKIRTVLERYDIPTPYFLFVGNIEPRKNLLLLVEAFEQLPTGTALVLIGGNSWLDEPIFAAIARAREQGATIIKPAAYVPDADVAAIMSGAIALVHPALHEGFGMTPLEALACGTLVLAADIPVLRETLSNTATYYNPLDTKSITQAMRSAQRIDQAKRTAQIKKGIIHSNHFSWEMSVKKLYTFLKTSEETRT